MDATADLTFIAEGTPPPIPWWWLLVGVGLAATVGIGYYALKKK